MDYLLSIMIPGNRTQFTDIPITKLSSYKQLYVVSIWMFTFDAYTKQIKGNPSPMYMLYP